MNERRRPRRGVIIAISVAVLVLLGAALGTTIWLLSRGDSPEAGAQRYLDALASGEADRVSPTLAVDAVLEDSTLEAFSAATAHLSEPTVTGVEMSGSAEATASADYSLAGARHSVTFTVRLEDGRWLAGANALGSVAATTSIGDAVTVGGVLLETSAVLVALPAAYEVAAAPAGILAGAAEAVVAPGEATQVVVEASLAPDVDARAQAAVDAYLEACTASSPESPAPTIPPSCGIGVPWGADLADAHGFVFRVEALPTVELDGTGGFLASGGAYAVTVSGTTRDGAAAEFTYRDDEWSLRGALEFSGGELVLHAW